MKKGKEVFVWEVCVREDGWMDEGMMCDVMYEGEGKVIKKVIFCSFFCFWYWNWV